MSENYSIIIIPTYNEIDNISDIIDEVFSLNNNFHVLVLTTTHQIIHIK